MNRTVRLEEFARKESRLKAFLTKCQEMKVKEVCIHLFIGYNSERGLKTAKDSS